jgi:putative heme-binding domain-containing protein
MGRMLHSHHSASHRPTILPMGLLALGLLLPLTAGDAPPAVGDPLARQLQPMVAITDLSPVQVLRPDFEVRELPVSLTNLINVAYAPDGRLFAAGYDGRLHVLRDRDGDGLEETVDTFVGQTSNDFTIGMVFRDGVLYELRGQQLIKHEDHDGDGIPETATVVAEGWDDAEMRADKAYTHRRVDEGLGLAIAPDGTIYLALGAANYNNGYLLDKAGTAHIDLGKRRGCVLRIRPGGKPEIFATGVRFLVSMHFNRAGDLFATDQEGATWLANGNPFDELLHLQEGRHYGFPPRHPRHLPNVIDEPSEFDYAPQHQSTCGFRFNEAAADGKSFGPAEWRGDAFVTGQSRGKLFRTILAKSSAGYVARTEVFASLDSLPVDVALAPSGDLLLTSHTGRPDWGSGPKGKGRLFKLRYVDHGTPQPVLVGALSPTELRVFFDRPFTSEQWKNVADGFSVEMGRHVNSGDAFESFRPGYQVINAQQAESRFRLPIAAVTLDADGRAATITTGRRVEDLRLVVRLSSTSATTTATGALAQKPISEMPADLGGVSATWTSATDGERWSGWLPHPDLTVARALTRGSSQHARLWDLLVRPGTLRLGGQLDLLRMLQPAIQPGAKLDYQPLPELVTVTFASSAALALASSARDGAAVSNDAQHAHVQCTSDAGWLPFTVTLTTGSGPADLNVSWDTAEDPRPRALPLRRIRMPWAVPAASGAAPALIPELAGGDAAAGRALFFAGLPGCARCHTIHGQGGTIAPNLSNLAHRDYASVLRDVTQPSAAINPDYPLYALTLNNGRILQGIIASSDAQTVRIGEITGLITSVPKADIVRLQALSTSLMPQGLLDGLTPTQVRDLMTFLMTPSE